MASTAAAKSSTSATTNRLPDGIHLAVDAMGGDLGPRLCVPASLAFLKDYPDSLITLVGDSSSIEQELEGGKPASLFIHHAEDIVSAQAKPAQALRSGATTSMWKSLNLLAQGRADACVSAGNTGAYMALARHLVGTHAAVDRPAICKTLPTRRSVAGGGPCYMLDLGANIGASAEQLVQFAAMGNALALAQGVSQPRVALLNVGSEETKGTHIIREAAESLQAHPGINYVGFIEGDSLFNGDVDVVVCDGFAGNVALKVSEGAARFIMLDLKSRLQKNLLGRVASVLGQGVFSAWKTAFSPSHYNGATLLGLQKTVVKSHGSTDQCGFYEALVYAKEQVDCQVVNKVEQQIHELGAAGLAKKTVGDAV